MESGCKHGNSLWQCASCTEDGRIADLATARAAGAAEARAEMKADLVRRMRAHADYIARGEEGFGGPGGELNRWATLIEEWAPDSPDPVVAWKDPAPQPNERLVLKETQPDPLTFPLTYKAPACEDCGHPEREHAVDDEERRECGMTGCCCEQYRCVK